MSGSTDLFSLDSFDSGTCCVQGPDGDRVVQMAISSPEKYVLKPQREGSGAIRAAGRAARTEWDKQKLAFLLQKDLLRIAAGHRYQQSLLTSGDYTPESGGGGFILADWA